MAHYAFLDQNKIVVEVITGIDENQLIEGINPEKWYENFRGLECKRTSYHGRIRGKYACIGDSYNEEEDLFIAPQPYHSWIRTGSYWTAPVPYPDDNRLHQWNEEKLQWESI